MGGRVEAIGAEEERVDSERVGGAETKDLEEVVTPENVEVGDAVVDGGGVGWELPEG